MFLLILLTVLFIPFLLIGGGLALFWKARRRAILRWTGIFYLAAIPFVLLGLGPFFMARFVSRGGTRQPDRLLKDTPADSGIAYENVRFKARDGKELSGWLIPPAQKNAVVILTHGLFRTRVEMLSRAVALAKAGYGALLYDSRNHGTSEKAIVSLGFYETQDVLGAIDYLQHRGQVSPKIVLMGVSMGAVATLRAAAQSDRYAALVIDSPFSSIRQTIIHHSWLFFNLPRFIFPPIFLFWFQLLTGFDVDEVNTLECIARVQPVPLLVIASEGDRRMPPKVARRLFQEAKAPVKRIEVFGNEVGHGASARLHPKEYAALLVGFLDQALSL
jgi:dipeptidyl aminopeptidase/acylaminoacyl peptidase